jgi:sugar/nucleoside kinase (ribokinase family)
LKPDIDILLIGHMTVDLVAGGRMVGGTVSYAAPTYAAFGHRVGIVTSAASDEPLLKHLRAHGELVLLPSEQTLTYENVYSAVGRQQYVRATASPIALRDVPKEWRSVRYAHLGPLAAEIDPLEMASGLPDATIMLTTQGLMRRWDDDGLVKFRRWFDEEALRLIDIVVYSEEDVHQFPQLTDKLRQVCPHLVVTNGRAGGTYYYGGDSMHYESIAVEPRDLTGAGDVFAGSLLGSLSTVNGDVAKAVRLAGRLAAYSVTRIGLDSAPTAAEIALELRNSKEG